MGAGQRTTAPGARPVPALGAAGLGITTLLASALGARRLRRRRS
ncbi:hypothetical protein [Paenacidovorax monticola]|nr:hypothetical protein [Paenacidovorax monticola]